MLLFLIDLLVFLCLAAQFAIAGYFLYLVYWLFELPREEASPPSLPADLPRVLVQVPVYNEPLVVERSMAAMGALDWPRDRLTIQLLDDSGATTAAASRPARWRQAWRSTMRPMSRCSTPISCRRPAG